MKRTWIGLLLFTLLFTLLSGLGNVALAWGNYYTFWYNANGGTNAPPYTKYNNINYSDDNHYAQLQISDQIPTRTGQDNLGTFTATLDANGGIVSQRFVSGSYREIYTFEKWNTKENGSGTSVASGDWLWVNLEDVSTTLYAQWEMSLQTDALTLPTPTRNGFLFLGWSTGTDKSGLVSNPYILTGNVTLYAIWSPLTGSCGENVSWSLNENGCLTFSGQGDIVQQGGENNWLTNKKEEILSVVIDNGVTGICDNAFSGCTRLASCFIPESVTIIGSYAFSGCSGLIHLTIPGSVTSVGSYAFQNCSYLTTAGQIGSESRIQFGWTDAIPAYAFYGSALRGVTIPETATEVGEYAFGNCEDLASVTIKTGVTSIGDNAFRGCSSLQELTIPESVTNIGLHAFKSCYKLTSAGPTGSDCKFQFGWTYRIPDRAFSDLAFLENVTLPMTVTSIGDYAFYDCLSLENVTIPNNVVRIGNSAFESTALRYANIPESVISIGTRAFCDSRHMTKVLIPSSVTSIGSGAFNGCSGLQVVRISSLEKWCTIRFGDATANPLYVAHNLSLYITSTDFELIRELSIPSSVTSISAYAFYGCSCLTSVTIPANVTEIGSNAFNSCSALTSVTIPESVTSIGSNAFYNCVSLTDLMLPENIRRIEDCTFYGCSCLTSVTIPANVTEIGSNTFNGCSALTSVTIPESVTSIGSNAFYNCASLTEVVIPENVRRIEDYTFYGCSALSSVTIPWSVTKIGVSAFYGCGALADVFYGGGNVDWTLVAVSTGNTALSSAEIHYGTQQQVARPWGELFWLLDENGKLEIYGEGPMDDFSSSSEEDAWHQAKTLVTQVVIREGVTSISAYAFYGFTSLDTVMIPASVTEIGNRAFDGAKNLTTVDIDDLEAWCDVGLTNWYDSPTYIAHTLYLNGELIQELIVPDSVTTISKGAFAGCSSLTSATFPEGLTNVDAYAFCDSGLTALKLPESLTSVGINAFYDCNALRSVYYNGAKMQWLLVSVESGNTELTGASWTYARTYVGGSWGELQWSLNDNGTLTISGQGFMDDFDRTSKEAWRPYKGKILSIVVEDGITSVGGYAFCECKSATSVSLPDSVESLGAAAFVDCTALNTLVLPASLRSIGKEAFIRCIFTSISIPTGVTSIGSGAFWNCSKLTRVVLPENLTQISGSLFNQCFSLSSVVIGNNVTSIGSRAFSQCHELTSVTIPASVTFIGNEAFLYCSSLKTIAFRGEMPEIRSDAFSNVRAKAYYPGELTSYTADVMTGYGGTLTWKARYTISYDANGGNGRPISQTKTEGTSITLATSVPVRDGYSFEGWAETPDAGTAQYQPGDLYSGDANLYLYAIWRRVTFSADQILVLPASLTEIEPEAFVDVFSEAVVVPDSVSVIGDEAFGNLIIIASSGGAAERYAQENGLTFLNIADCVIR